MGKLIIVSGENDSGKSLFAENIVAKCSGRRYYIATMIPKTEENREKIKKHQKQRENLNFTTLEVPYNLVECKIDKDAAVLIEDVSNLLANNIFEKDRGADEVFCDILNLAQKCSLMVAVTISGFDSLGYDGETAMYIDSLNRINEKLKSEACVCVTMTDGKPVYEKGESYDIY